MLFQFEITGLLVCLNQNEDPHLYCNFNFELVPLGVDAFLFKPYYAANLRIKDEKTPNFLLQSQPLSMVLDCTDFAS